MPVAVVSNNSAGAVTAYLTSRRLAAHVSPVVGRSYARPDQMKPNPEPIWQSTRALNITPHRAVLVGDSLSDIEGARAAGICSVGYANTPPRSRRFSRQEQTS
jgi:HAD superfamily hydrolase (TIGR01509 family)